MNSSEPAVTIELYGSDTLSVKGKEEERKTTGGHDNFLVPVDLEMIYVCAR